MGIYDDILNLERPKSDRPRMPIGNRAKIFMPFAALKGYEDMISEQQKQVTERKLLSEMRKAELDEKMQHIKEQMKSGEIPEVTVQHFVLDEKKSLEAGKELGTYEVVTGKIEKIESIFKILKIGGKEIHLEDIDEIKFVNDL